VAKREESEDSTLRPEARLGAALRRARENRGISLRALARKLYRSHSNLVEYERGHRLAPPDVVQAYEAELGLAPRTLAVLYERAQRELYAKDSPRRMHFLRSSPAEPALRQLPPDVSDFTGREAELAELRAIVGKSVVKKRTTVVISAIAGMGGVGKTALALHLAHELMPQFPDIQLYINLHGYEPHQRLSPSQALDRLLRALGVVGEALPQELDEQISLYRSRLAGNRALVVLDNASSAEQVRPLLPGSSASVVIVTSRDRLVGLVARDGARLLDLDVLSTDDAVELLARVADRGRIDKKSPAAAEIVRLCGYLPLAVRIAGAKLATRPGMSLAELAGRLADEQRRLGELSAGDTEVRASFALSYEDLAPACARMFRRLGLVAGPDFAAGVAATLADVTFEESGVLLETLVDAHPLETAPIQGRYRFHDLLRLYARDRLKAEETESERDEALRRMMEWYLLMARAASAQLIPGRSSLFYDPSVQQPELDPAARVESLRWFETERANLVAATRQAAGCGFHQVAWQLPDAMWSFFFLRRRWADWEQTHQIGLSAARKALDRRAEAWMMSNLGVACRDLRRYKDGIDYHERALAISREIGDRWLSGWILERLGVACRLLRRFEEAVDCCEQALAIFREIQDRYAEGLTLTSLGMVYGRVGRFRKAIDCFDQALAIRRGIGDRRGEAVTLAHFGSPYLGLRRFEEAVDCCEQALAIFREMEDRYGEGWCLRDLGCILQSIQRTDAAQACWREALAIFADLGAPDADEVLAYLDRENAIGSRPQD
jgi:tetratricopeptide (TPR) repeat protein